MSAAKSASHNKFIGLLRGINVGGHNKVPMTELRSLCEKMGWAEVQTYIQSGNLVFSASATCAELERQLEQSLKKQFGIEIAVIVRDADKWSEYVRSNPFPGASRETPNLVMLALSKAKPNADAAKLLTARANNNERVKQVDDALWAHFKEGSARSKLTPALINRLVGSSVTTRNWRTVVKLADLASVE